MNALDTARETLSIQNKCIELFTDTLNRIEPITPEAKGILTQVKKNYLDAMEALSAIEAEKPTEGDLPCFLTTCQWFDKECLENCSAESNGEPAIASCNKYLTASKIIIDYHSQECAKCKGKETKVIKSCETCADYPYDCLAPKKGMFCEGKNWKPLQNTTRHEKRSPGLTDE